MWTEIPSKTSVFDRTMLHVYLTDPRGYLEAVARAANEEHISAESGFRLMFAVLKSWDLGHMWWTRTKLAKHLNVDKTTVTRDYKLWASVGLVKIRSNPFRANTNLVIFPWSKVWDDALWDNAERVASMLPEIGSPRTKKGLHGCNPHIGIRGQPIRRPISG